MKRIPLTQGKYALVDDEDYERVNNLKWHACKHHNTWYALHSPTEKPPVKMHRFIMNAAKGVQVDHSDGDGLNNQKSNLRKATHSQNIWNSRLKKNNTSGFKGVHWNKIRKVYQAYIYSNNKHIYLGGYSDPEKAARAYDKKARELFGEFAWLNFP